MQKCLHCQTANADGALLCSKCGKSLTMTAPAPSAASTIPAPAPQPMGTSMPVAASAPAAVGVSNISMDHHSVVEGTPYKPSGAFEISKLPLMFFGGLIAAAIVGLIYALISRFFNMIVIFPIIAGACTGGVLYKINTGVKNRNVPLAAIIGLGAGFLTYGFGEFDQALSLRKDLLVAKAQEIYDAKVAADPALKNADPDKLPDATVTPLIRSSIQEAQSQMGLFGTLTAYENYQAQYGVTLKRNGTGSGITISGWGYWGLFGLELIICTICAGVLCIASAQKPFCESCNKWHKDKNVLKVHPMQNEAVLEKIKAKDWPGLLDLPNGQITDDKANTTVNVTHCEGCGSGTLMVTSTTAIPGMVRQNLAPASTQALVNGLS